MPLAVLAYQADMYWELPKYRYYLSMIRFWNNMCKLDGNNLTKKVFEWSLQNFIPNTLEFNILTVLETTNLTNHFDNCDEVDGVPKFHLNQNYGHVPFLNIVFLLNHM